MDFQSVAAYNPNKETPRPYVRFEMRPMEDRTIKSPDGVTQMRDVAWAIVSANGSRDSVEKLAEDWLQGLAAYAKDGRIPMHWPSEYRSAFEHWKKGEEMPVHGTPIKSWPPLTPAQRANLLRADIHTVEVLADANDEIRARIGMGAVNLQQMAQTWLAESKDRGAMAKELDATKLALADLQRTVKEQAEALRALQPKAK